MRRCVSIDKLGVASSLERFLTLLLTNDKLAFSKPPKEVSVTYTTSPISAIEKTAVRSMHTWSVFELETRSVPYGLSPSSPNLAPTREKRVTLLPCRCRRCMFAYSKPACRALAYI